MIMFLARGILEYKPNVNLGIKPQQVYDGCPDCRFILFWVLDETGLETSPIDITTTESEIADTHIEIVIPEEPEGDVIDYIVDVATTKRSLNNGPDIARHCIQQSQTTVGLNHLPLNGTNI